MSFSISELSEEMKEETLAGKKVEPMVFKKEDIRIVLEKQGKITNLLHYTGPLEYTTTGKGMVIDFDKRRPKSLRVMENIEDPKQLPENCVYMVADKDLYGKIAYSFLLSLAIESLSCHSLLFLPQMGCIGTFF